MKCGTNMFYSQPPPFEYDRRLSDRFLSADSVKNLNGLKHTTRALCQSDSNIPRTCVRTGSKKRQRWTTKAVSLTANNKNEKENSLERASKRSKDAVTADLEKKPNEVELYCQPEDSECVDDCREDVNSVSGDGDAESRIEKSENRCLQKKTSIINLKAIKNNAARHAPYDFSSQDIIKSCDDEIIVHLNSDFQPSEESPRHKNSGSSFLSICSLFSLSKSPVKSAELFTLQQNTLTARLTCCPLGSQKTNTNAPEPAPDTSDTVVNTSPKPVVRSLFSDVHSTKCRTVSFSSSSDDTSLEDMAPIASPEATSTLSLRYAPSQPVAKLKLLHEGDIQVCYLSRTRTIFRKVLSSKLLRRWETHHIYLREDCLCSKTPTGFLESPIPYSSLDEVYVVGRWDCRNRCYIRLVMAEGSLLLQTSNSLVRDQWLSSLLWKKNMHKYKNILQTSTRPEVILKEIKSLVFSSTNSLLQDDCIRNVPIEIVSRVLTKDELWRNRELVEEVIGALAPLLEDSTPSPQMFSFFSRHILSHPRSPVILDVFTSVVQRILKRTMDFGKCPLTRRFVADYFKALYSQNDGEEAVRKFIRSVHGGSFGCPHPRVLPNLVAVSLAAVFSHFEERKILQTESANETNCNEASELLDKQLECFVAAFLAISEYEDWRCRLSQLLQPIPFPDDALSHSGFIKGFLPVLRAIGTDSRCEVHETVLGIREGKEGWLNVFCPSSLVCKDEGVLWCQMLETLFNCCCRRKSFLQKMAKYLGALLLMALRGHAVAQEMLCLMLEWRLIVGEDQKMQIVTTLQSTQSGREKYSELCKRQEHLKELQKEEGPKKLTLPSRSTDADVARLVSCRSFGNLECLSLAFTHVTSACAHQLILLPALRYLNLWATQFGDAGLMIIAEHLDKLQVLNLCETPVSDKGIAAIAGMRNLKKLNLNSTKLSPQTLDTLKMKLPTLQELDVRYTDAW